MMKRIARPALIAAAALLGGCVSLLPETAPPKPRYHIEPVEASALEGETVDWSLIIEDPRATKVYDTVRIAVSTAPGKIEYFAGAEWADRAPRLFQTALVQTFEDSGRILAVGDRSALPLADIVLQTDIRRLELNTQGGQAATVSIYARLTDGRSRIVAAKRFDASAPAASDNADAVIAAFDAAFETLIPEIVDWTYREGVKRRASRG